MKTILSLLVPVLAALLAVAPMPAPASADDDGRTVRLRGQVVGTWQFVGDGEIQMRARGTLWTGDRTGVRFSREPRNLRRERTADGWRFINVDGWVYIDVRRREDVIFRGNALDLQIIGEGVLILDGSGTYSLPGVSGRIPQGGTTIEFGGGRSRPSVRSGGRVALPHDSDGRARGPLFASAPGATRVPPTPGLATEPVAVDARGRLQVFGEGHYETFFAGNLVVDDRTRLEFLYETNQTVRRTRIRDGWRYDNVNGPVRLSGRAIQAQLSGTVRGFAGEGRGVVIVQGQGSVRTTARSGTIPQRGLLLELGDPSAGPRPSGRQ